MGTFRLSTNFGHMCNTAESMGDYPTIGRARNCAPPGLSDSKTRNSELRRDFAAFVNPNVSVGPRDGHEPPLSKLGVVTLPAGSAAGGGGEHPKPKEPQPPLPTNAYTAEHRHGHDTGFETCKHVNVEHHSFQGGKVTPTEPVPDPKMSRSFGCPACTAIRPCATRKGKTRRPNAAASETLEVFIPSYKQFCRWT